MAQIEHGTYIRPFVYQKVAEPKHFMVKFKGFGISNYVLKKLQENEVRYIQIIYLTKEKKITYFATTKQYLQSEKTHSFDGDVQKFVDVKEMLVI